jgi:predicted lipoprotein with Yx(FWY)xxD motif
MANETRRSGMPTTQPLRAAQVACVVVLALVSMSCGTGDNGAEPGNAPASTAPASSAPSAPRSGVTETPTSDAPRASGTTITAASSEFGEVLWGPDRQVVYIWEREPSATAECYDDCAAAWPPVLTTGDPVAAGEVDPGLLGTTTRRDGSTQVTYSGHPLYYYAHEGPGEVKCHNISTHGGLWWVVTPTGERAP